MIELDNNQKFEAIKYRHQDMSNLLQVMTATDLKIFIGFITLQLALGGFITQVSLGFSGKVGLLIIDISLSVVCSILFHNHHLRRREVVDVIKNCNQALGYNTPGVYIENRSINTPTINRPWYWLFIVGVALSILGLIAVMKTNKKQINHNSTHHSTEVSDCLKYFS